MKTREEEIKLLAQHLENVWYAGANTDLEALFEQAVQWADEHPKNPWISLREQTPEPKKRVLFLGKNGKAYFGYGNINGISATIINGLEGNIVTHWMPIPKLKEGE